MEICVIMDRYSSDLNMGLCSHVGAMHDIAMGILLEVALVDRKVTARLVSLLNPHLVLSLSPIQEVSYCQYLKLLKFKGVTGFELVGFLLLFLGFFFLLWFF